MKIIKNIILKIIFGNQIVIRKDIKEIRKSDIKFNDKIKKIKEYYEEDRYDLDIYTLRLRHLKMFLNFNYDMAIGTTLYFSLLFSADLANIININFIKSENFFILFFKVFLIFAVLAILTIIVVGMFRWVTALDVKAEKHLLIKYEIKKLEGMINSKLEKTETIY